MKSDKRGKPQVANKHALSLGEHRRHTVGLNFSEGNHKSPTSARVSSEQAQTKHVSSEFSQGKPQIAKKRAFVAGKNSDETHLI